MLMKYQNNEKQEDKEYKTCKDGEENKRVYGALDLYSDPEMENFFTRGIRGGQSFISQRYATGNDNPEKSGKHMLYVDGKGINFIDVIPLQLADPVSRCRALHAGSSG